MRTEGQRLMNGFIFKVLLKAPEEFADFMCKIFDRCDVSGAIANLFGKFKEVLGFGKGASGYVNKAYKLLVAFPAIPFDDICRNRERSPSQLAGNAKLFMTGKGFGNSVHGNGQFMGLLPDNQLLVGRHGAL